MSVVSMKQLLEAGVHFGHQTRRWNPKMAQYIYMERNGIYIIDLQKTVKKLDEAYNFVREISQTGGNILFVGTKKQAQDAVKEEAERVGMFFVNARWLGGMLTNFKTMRQRIDRLAQLRNMQEDGTFDILPKKEVIKLTAEINRLEKYLGGVKDMKRLPAALFIVDPKKERNAIAEAHKLKIPIVAIVDTNCDPDEVDYIIPGNDDAIRAIRLITQAMANAVTEGRQGEETGEVTITATATTVLEGDEISPTSSSEKSADIAATPTETVDLSPLAKKPDEKPAVASTPSSDTEKSEAKPAKMKVSAPKTVIETSDDSKSGEITAESDPATSKTADDTTKKATSSESDSPSKTAAKKAEPTEAISEDTPKEEAAPKKSAAKKATATEVSSEETPKEETTPKKPAAKKAAATKATTEKATKDESTPEKTVAKKTSTTRKSSTTSDKKQEAKNKATTKEKTTTGKTTTAKTTAKKETATKKSSTAETTAKPATKATKTTAKKAT